VYDAPLVNGADPVRGGVAIARRVRFGPPLACPREARSDRAAAEVFWQRLMDAIAALRPIPEESANR